MKRHETSPHEPKYFYCVAFLFKNVAAKGSKEPQRTGNNARHFLAQLMTRLKALVYTVFFIKRCAFLNSFNCTFRELKFKQHIFVYICDARLYLGMSYWTCNGILQSLVLSPFYHLFGNLLDIFIGNPQENSGDSFC